MHDIKLCGSPDVRMWTQVVSPLCPYVNIELFNILFWNFSLDTFLKILIEIHFIPRTDLSFNKFSLGFRWRWVHPLSLVYIVLDPSLKFQRAYNRINCICPQVLLWNQSCGFLNTDSGQGIALAMWEVTPTFRAPGTPSSGFCCWLTVCTVSSPLLFFSHLSDFWIWSASCSVLRPRFYLI